MESERRLTDPLRIEHRQLVPRVEELRLAAAGLRDRDPGAAIGRVDKALSFLEVKLLPHARAEEAELYPLVERAFGCARVTDTMRRDHIEIERMTDALRYFRSRLAEGPRSDTIEALRRLLYGLHAVVMLHFAKEEEIYLPLLDERLSEQSAGRLIEAMHAAETEPSLTS